MSDKQFFTVEEANELLPTIEPLLEGLRDAQAVMEARQDEVMESSPTNGGGEAHREFLQASSSAARATATLEELGIVLRDPSTGLIDFHSQRDGEEVFLCWRLGEDAIAWWHPVDTGFSGRRPL
ncbi:MAG TPA: DUF2203 domain-containing protein [Actinomycetota bacterium]|nr:DUF2203 domain-containing protein [Actinomycetota bacterium]